MLQLDQESAASPTPPSPGRIASPIATGHAAVDGRVLRSPDRKRLLAGELRKLGHSYFLPMVLRVTTSGGRRRRNLYPLFASYIFLPADESARLAALRTERIVRFVDVTTAQQPTFRREIAALETAPADVPGDGRAVPEPGRGDAGAGDSRAPSRTSRASSCSTSSGTSCGWG